jgi:hypothetical protein
MVDEEEKVCDFSCEYAEFAKDAYCSDNITMYCKKYKKMVRKYAECLKKKKRNKGAKKQE